MKAASKSGKMARIQFVHAFTALKSMLIANRFQTHNTYEKLSESFKQPFTINL